MAFVMFPRALLCSDGKYRGRPRRTENRDAKQDCAMTGGCSTRSRKRHHSSSISSDTRKLQSRQQQTRSSHDRGRIPGVSVSLSLLCPSLVLSSLVFSCLLLSSLLSSSLVFSHLPFSWRVLLACLPLFMSDRAASHRETLDGGPKALATARPRG